MSSNGFMMYLFASFLVHNHAHLIGEERVCCFDDFFPTLMWCVCHRLYVAWPIHYKLFLCSTQLILNVACPKMLKCQQTPISKINTTSESLKARNSVIFKCFNFLWAMAISCSVELRMNIFYNLKPDVSLYWCYNIVFGQWLFILSCHIIFSDSNAWLLYTVCKLK